MQIRRDVSCSAHRTIIPENTTSLQTVELMVMMMMVMMMTIMMLERSKRVASLCACNHLNNDVVTSARFDLAVIEPSPLSALHGSHMIL